MEKLLEIILFVVYIAVISFSQSYTIHVISKITCKKAFSTKNLLISFLVLIPVGILGTWIYYSIPKLNFLKSILGISSLVILTFILYKPNIVKGIITSLLCTIIPFVFDMILVLILSLFSDITNMNQILNNKPVFYSLNIATCLWCILAIKILDMFISKKHSSTKQTTDSNINYNVILYQGLLILISLIPSMVLMFSNNYDYPIGFVMLNTFQLIIVSTFSVLYMKKQIHFKDNELELENTKLHNQALSTINENIRGFKHDMGNMVQAINGYLAVGNIDGVKKYCQNLLHGFNDVNLLSILSPKIINEPAIYGVVVSKMLYARENSLNLSLDIGLDVSSINFPSFELSRIIGILLDNAIEASLESNEKKLKLEMYYDDNKKADVIIIGNSVKDPDKVDVIKMFEKDYSTKENPSGFGLFEVLKFLRKNHKGDIVPNIDYDKNFFTQTLTFDK